MIRILQSGWMAALLAAIAFLGTTSYELIQFYNSAPADIATELDNLDASVNGPSWRFTNPELDQLIADLRTEKENLDARAQQLDELATRLQNERSELNQVTQMVSRIQQDFDHEVTSVHEEEMANLKHLAKVYAAMTPASAVIILKELDDQQIVKILCFMKEAETAPILEAFANSGAADARRAAMLSERIRLTLMESAAKKGAK